MNYCPRCGSPVSPGQNFCWNCGFDVGEKAGPVQAPEVPAERDVRGLGRNTLVYLTQEGIKGTKVTAISLLGLALLAPLPILVWAYSVIQAGALVVYATLWIAASAVLYDEIRWRGLRKLEGDAEGKTASWLVPWQSIRMADWNGRTLWFTSTGPRRKLSVTFDRNDAPIVERVLNSWGVRYSWRPPRLPPVLTRFWTLVLLLFIVGQVIYVSAAVLPFFSGEQQAYATILTNTRNQIAGTTFLGEFQAIFLNNLQVAWGGALPFLGTLTYGVASYNTGRVVQVIAITNTPQPVTPSVVLIGLYLLPHFWVEESAYPIATVAGLLAFTKWRSVSPTEFVRWANRGSAKLVLAMGGTATILVIAALIEVFTGYLSYDALGLWVPLVLLYYLWKKTKSQSLTQSMGSP